MKKVKKFKIEAEIVKGECPSCSEITTLVGISSQFFRCMECGGDLELFLSLVVLKNTILLCRHYAWVL